MNALFRILHAERLLGWSVLELSWRCCLCENDARRELAYKCDHQWTAFDFLCNDEPWLWRTILDHPAFDPNDERDSLLTHMVGHNHVEAASSLLSRGASSFDLEGALRVAKGWQNADPVSFRTCLEMVRAALICDSQAMSRWEEDSLAVLREFP